MRSAQTRRDALLSLAAVLVPFPAAATPEEVAASIAASFGDRPRGDGPIELDVPPIAESGNSVPLTVRVASPMTADDRVRRLAVFTEANPRPKAFEMTFGPAAAEASLTTNARDRLRGEPISQGQVNGFPIYHQLCRTWARSAG